MPERSIDFKLTARLGTVDVHVLGVLAALAALGPRDALDIVISALVLAGLTGDGTIFQHPFGINFTFARCRPRSTIAGKC